MQSKLFNVDNIACEHCVHTIKSELSDLKGVTSVEVDQETKQVEVKWQDPLSWDEIKNLLEEINYPPNE